MPMPMDNDDEEEEEEEEEAQRRSSHLEEIRREMHSQLSSQKRKLQLIREAQNGDEDESDDDEDDDDKREQEGAEQRRAMLCNENMTNAEEKGEEEEEEEEDIMIVQKTPSERGIDDYQKGNGNEEDVESEELVVRETPSEQRVSNGDDAGESLGQQQQQQQHRQRQRQLLMQTSPLGDDFRIPETQFVRRGINCSGMDSMQGNAAADIGTSGRVLMRVNRGTVAWMMSLSDDRLVFGVLTEGDTESSDKDQTMDVCFYRDATQSTQEPAQTQMHAQVSVMRLRRRRRRRRSMKRKQEKGRTRSSSRVDTHGSYVSVDDALVSASACGGWLLLGGGWSPHNAATCVESETNGGGIGAEHERVLVICTNAEQQQMKQQQRRQQPPRRRSRRRKPQPEEPSAPADAWECHSIGIAEHGIEHESLSSIVIAPAPADDGAEPASAAFSILMADARDASLVVLALSKDWDPVGPSSRVHGGSDATREAGTAMRLLLLKQSPGCVVGISNTRICVWNFVQKQLIFSSRWNDEEEGLLPVADMRLGGGGILQFAEVLLVPLPESVRTDDYDGDDDHADATCASLDGKGDGNAAASAPVELILYHDANRNRVGIIALTARRLLGEVLNFCENDDDDDSKHDENARHGDAAVESGESISSCCVTGFGTPLLVYDRTRLCSYRIGSSTGDSTSTTTSPSGFVLVAGRLADGLTAERITGTGDGGAILALSNGFILRFHASMLACRSVN